MAVIAHSSRRFRMQILEITDGPSKSDLFRGFQVAGENLIFADTSVPVESKLYTITVVRSLPSLLKRRDEWLLEGTVKFLSSQAIRRFRMRYNTRTGKGKVKITELAPK